MIMNYIEDRIGQLEAQLKNPECNNPLKIGHKLEAYQEMQQQLKLFAMPDVSQQRELLIDYHESQIPRVRESHSIYIEKCVDDYLSKNEKQIIEL
jgi:hypothetical protein